MLHIMQQSAKGEVHEARFNRAKKLWDKSISMEEIADDIGISRKIFTRWVKDNPQHFPERGRADSRILTSEKVAENGVAEAHRHAWAYLPLPGTKPVTLDCRAGCEWPIDFSGDNPLTSTAPLFFCNAPKMKGKDERQPPRYCEGHHRIAFRMRVR